MRNIALKLMYNGTAYHGWQVQKTVTTVGQTLEEAAAAVVGHPVHMTGCGRTDAGVHAEGQVVHFDADTSIPVDKIPFAVNTHLPDDVSMLSCEVVSDDFNARFNAKRKTYCYKTYISKHRRPVLEPTHEHIIVPVDLDKIKEACKIIEGTHDFKCFEASGSIIKNTVRTIYSIEVETAPLQTYSSEDSATEKDGLLTNSVMNVYVTGNGFLYNMVRIIAGTLLYVGIGKLTPDDVRTILESGDRKLAGKTLSAKGLHLIQVIY